MSIALLAMAVPLHVVQLMSLGPWAAHWPRAGAWPMGFHLWIVETVCMVMGAATWLAHHQRLVCLSWLQRLTGTQRAWILTAVMLGAQTLLALGFWLTRNQGVDKLGGLRAVFWLGGEFRLHALFCVAQAWCAAWLAWRVFRLQRQPVWAATALICAYIGLDELLSIHEAVGVWLRTSGWLQFNSLRTLDLGSSGVHVYAWQLVFLPLAAGLGLALLHAFWRVLDARTLGLLVCAALMFVGGAVGLETVQATASTHDTGWSASDAGHLNLLLEEALETVGMTLALFVFAARAWRDPASSAPKLT